MRTTTGRELFGYKGINMPSPQVIDVSSLLIPISADNAVGLDLRQDTTQHSLYSRIRDARKAARAAERKNLFDNNSTEADEHWRQVFELAPQALKEKTKDLEIACWFTESLIRKAGFRGLRDGFSLIRQLIETFWDNIYPLPDDDGIATRLAALTGLNGEGAEGVLIAPIRTAYITEGSQSGQPFSYWQYKQALDAQRMTGEQARAEQIAKNGFNLDDIQNVVNQSSQEFYVNLRDDVRDALEEYKRIGQLLVERCGVHDSPPTSNIVNILTDTLSAITHIAREKLPEPETTDGAAGAEVSGEASVGGAIKSRAEALKQLGYISQFFRRTEPHSPLSYIIEKAVRWGDMSLGELMHELIPDSSSRSTYSSLTGVTTNEE
jgi:type VI secretion system protein ImpA